MWELVYAIWVSQSLESSFLNDVISWPESKDMLNLPMDGKNMGHFGHILSTFVTQSINNNKNNMHGC